MQRAIAVTPGRRRKMGRLGAGNVVTRLGDRIPATPRILSLLIGTGAGALGLGYLAVWLLGRPDTAMLPDLWPVSLIGVFGASVANSTGVGGGVVFVPVFNLLREGGLSALDPQTVVGVSFAIQCFGMSAGSLTWIARLWRPAPMPGERAAREHLPLVVALTMTGALPSLLLTQRFSLVDGQTALFLFKGFSIGLGLLLLAQLARRDAPDESSAGLTRMDRICVLGIGVLGGVATALFSVGVGEMLALYLFLRRYPLELCVAPAVICSALSVLAGVGHHIAAGQVVTEILVFAAPAVVLGGYVGRWIAQKLGAFRLKLFTGVWIVGSSLALVAMT
jgi:uncharacterized membrane protein YfcA